MVNTFRYLSKIESFLLGILFLWVGRVFAYESYPEFRSLSEDEQSELESPINIEPEYHSHIISYRKPIRWESWWLQQERAMDLTIGSVSANKFFTDQRLKARARLLDPLEFRFTYFDNRDFDVRGKHLMLELAYWITDWLAIDAYGELSFFKREDDTGLAILLRPHPGHEIRIFHTWIDVTRLKRNDRSDTYVEPDLPYARGIVGRYVEPIHDAAEQANFFQYAFRWETHTRWQLPDSDSEYRYRKFMASLWSNRVVNSQLEIGFRFQYDYRMETNFPTSSSSTVSDERWETRRYLSSADFRWIGWGPRQSWELTGGLDYANRRWLTNGDQKVVHRNWLPHTKVRIPTLQRAQADGPDHLEVGTVLSVFGARGPAALRSPNDLDDQRADGRLNLGYRFRFSNRSELLLLTTFDLDKFGTNKSWEGGNGQFRVSF